MCKNFPELMKAQSIVIKKCVEYHAWCNKIEDHSTAAIDFIKKYGWIMRATFCESCVFKISCDIDWKELKN